MLINTLTARQQELRRMDMPQRWAWQGGEEIRGKLAETHKIFLSTAGFVIKAGSEGKERF